MLDAAFQDARWTGHLVVDGDQPWVWYDPSRYEEQAPAKREAADPMVEAAVLLQRLVRHRNGRFSLRAALTFLDEKRPRASAELVVAYTSMVEAHGVLPPEAKPKRDPKRKNYILDPEQRAAFYKARYQKRKARYATMTPEQRFQAHATKHEKAQRAQLRERLAAGLPPYRRDVRDFDHERMAQLFRELTFPRLVAEAYGCRHKRAMHWRTKFGARHGIVGPFPRDVGLRPTTYVWTRSRLGKLRACLLLGMSENAMAQRLGISNMTIRRAIERHPRLLAPRPVSWTPEFVTYVSDMLDLGMTYRQIADQFDLPRSTIESGHYKIVNGLRGGRAAPRQGRRRISRIGACHNVREK